MKGPILLGIILAALCKVELKLTKDISKGLYYVETSIGSSNFSTSAAIDLSGLFLVVPCYYSHTESKDIYLPYLSNSSKYKEKADNCKLEAFGQGLKQELCELTLEILPGQKVILNEFNDKIKLGDVLFDSTFLCIENIETYLSIQKNAVLGLGPNSLILNEICQRRSLPKRLYFDFAPDKGEMWIGVHYSKSGPSIIKLEKETNKYLFTINSIAFSNRTNTTAIIVASDFYLDSNSRYSFLTTQNYFSLTRDLKSLLGQSVTSEKHGSRDCFVVPKLDGLKNFPDLVLKFTDEAEKIWKPSEYFEKISEKLYCIGILPSFTNTLGMNFLQGKKLLIDLKESTLEFLENPPQETNSIKPKVDSNTTLIIFICICVILLQIAIGYHFLNKNRGPPQLQPPNIPVSPLDISY